jgi:hypothetical protein
VKKILQAIIGVVLSAVTAQTVTAQTWNYAVQVSATVQESPARITLSWSQDTSGTPSSYTVYRKSAGSTSWGGGTSLSGSTLTYTDTSVAVGTPYEYQIVKAMGSYTGYGYIYTGINVPLTDNRGKVILVVDNTVAGPLASELTRLEKDLVGDGWTVVRRDVSRTDSVVNVKNVIKSAYNADPANTKAVFLFGHVPVPYSGNIVPDGHFPEHQGAWPADGYYGDMDGTWTDNSVSNNSAENARNRNVPGDGKFDQSDMPSQVELQVGRVDLANMPGWRTWGGPATFPSEIELLRNYLRKDHEFRHKRINPPARGVVFDQFGVMGGQAFAASGYRSFAPLVGPSQITTLPNLGTWIPHLRDNPALLAYGCGAGSYTSIGGLGNTPQYNDGTTTEIYDNDVKTVFTMLFGSWLGDWDSRDNIMRGILATPSMGLVCAWSGRPHWYYHHLGLGEPIGYAAKIAQNNPEGGLYRNQHNAAAGSIHLGLMGDPTLRLHPVAPPSNVSISGGQLTWSASSDAVIGYHVYRADNAAGPFTRITTSPINGTSYPAADGFVYMVKAVKVQSSPSGTYYNSSQGLTAGSGGGGGDTTQPTISITAPTGGTVSGSVAVSANASDNVGVVGVQFQLDGANIGAEDTSSPYTVTWNSTATANGSHTLTAIARDAAGNQRVSSAVTVNVSNSTGGDTTQPTVSITAPANAAAVSGSSVSVSANASDNVGVAGVQFQLDGANLGSEDTSAPYSVTWNSTATANGSHTLTAIARDAAGNQRVSSAVTVNVSNSSGGGTPSVSVTAIDSTAVEGFDNPATFRFTRTGDTAPALTVSFSLSGSAIKWNDYRRRIEGDMPVQITIPAGAASVDLTVHAWPDSETESTETCMLTVTAGTGYTVGSPNSAAISMSDTGTPDPVGDTTPPVLAITAPAPSSITLGTSVNLSASASDNVGVSGVQFRLNGSNLGAEDTSSPYGATWSTTGLGAGTYAIAAVGRDAAGNRATSTVVNVILTSTPPPDETNDTNVIVTGSGKNILQLPNAGDHQLRILSPTVLELQLITRKDPDPAPPSTWNFVNSSQQFTPPAASEFNVTANGQAIAVQSVSFKRRPIYAPLFERDLRLENNLYLRLASPIADGQSVQVRNPSGSIITSAMQFTNVASATRYSPAIHVNQEGYVPSFPKQAMVGYYLGNGGELDIPSGNGFKIVNAHSGATVFQGALTSRLDVGLETTPLPYQKVYEADFTSLTTPGEYLLVVPGLGASLPFLIDEGIAMGFTRAYALGLYHQRCGGEVGLPHSRHEHDACHTAQADIPLPAASFPFTWTKIAEKSAENVDPRQTAPQLRDEASQLYPIINRGKIDISHGHHDAGDYSKYTINSAALLHHLTFAVDSLNGVAALDNLGLPESGDGISDVLQLARWEADFLSKIQDADGGFYFLIYPRNRAYEGDVPPDKGDAQVVWPKNTAATAAAVAALAQIGSSPAFKAAYPAEAAAHLAKAKLGWQFLINAITRHGKDGAYQKITHYGHQFIHDDELAWAAASLFAATGEAQYHTKLKEWYDPASPSTLHWGWWRLFEGYGCAVRSYAFAARSGRLQASQLDSAYLAKCEQQITLAAQDRTTDAQEHAYGSSFPPESKRIFSAGWFFSTERAFDIAVGYQLNPRADYKEALVSNMNYEGGCNPVNMPHVTGLGWKRQRQIVHQWAHNDRRALPPSGIPQGNIVSHFSYLENYKGELNALCFPGNDIGTGRYAMYDRWSDVHNVTAEFVNVDQARGLGALAVLATLTSAKSTPWKAAPSATISVPTETTVGAPITATLQVPGMNLSGARIVWEAKDNEPAFGSSYTFTPKGFGGQWVEVEAQWPDGRRAFAAVDLYATNHLPILTVAATAPVASERPEVRGAFTFTRRGGNINAPVTVNFRYSGTATKWDDFYRPEGDAPETITIPAGASSATLTLVARPDTIAESTETVNLTISPTSAYELGLTSSATMMINETGGPKISGIKRSSNGEMTVTWNSQTGTMYQILYKDSLDQSGWRTLQTGISATGDTTSFIDSSAASAPMRFYSIKTL